MSQYRTAAKILNCSTKNQNCYDCIIRKHLSNNLYNSAVFYNYTEQQSTISIDLFTSFMNRSKLERYWTRYYSVLNIARFFWHWCKIINLEPSKKNYCTSFQSEPWMLTPSNTERQLNQFPLGYDVCEHDSLRIYRSNMRDYYNCSC